MAELQPPEGPINGGTLVPPSTENVGTKRQRRPSVRLGDIGDQHFDLHLNRRPKQWKVPVKDSGKSSKTRPLVNLSGSADFHETLDGEDKEPNLESPAIRSWRVRDSKSKRGLTTKRLRSSWVSKVDEGVEIDGKFSVSGGEDVDDGFRDFDPEGSESPLKEQTPIHSADNMATDTDRVHENEREVNYHGHMRGFRARVSEGREDLEGPSDTDARNWHSSERNGVRAWLNQLGLGRYAPVFEIHEVDDEVLPMLTLQDLKDMGINAVGSRRKMYCSIQKLGKGFS